MPSLAEINAADRDAFVSMLGGVVSADNGPDGGFRVVVDLPLAYPAR